MIDLWHEKDRDKIDGMDCYFNDADCRYHGNLYVANWPVGDYTAKDSAEVERIANRFCIKWNWNYREKVIKRVTKVYESHKICYFEGKTIVDIRTENGEKTIHYCGYGYRSEGDVKPYRFLEYIGFEAPLKEVLKSGIYSYEDCNQEQYKQYITDCSEEECRRIYETYDNGKFRIVIDADDIDEKTPDGTYILL